MEGFIKRLGCTGVMAVGGVLTFDPLVHGLSNFLPGLATLELPPLQAQDLLTNQLFQQVNPAVVEVRLSNGSGGSGFIVDAGGKIITNAHVLDELNATTATVRLADGRQVEADILGYDRRGQDLAALQIYGLEGLPSLALETQLPQTGESAYAIGFPYELGRTLTVGVISQVLDDKGWIQTDADINFGNSGGPLVNGRGQVVGVNTWSFQPLRNAGSVGLNTAIAAHHVRRFLLDLRMGNVASQPTHTDNSEHPRRSLPLRGQTITGHFGEGDRVHGDESYIDYYYFDASAGQHLVAEMVSSEVDAFLSLRQLIDDGEPPLITLAYGDDLTPTDTNARIEITLPENATYRLDANTFDGQQTGGYTLSAYFNERPPRQEDSPETVFFCGDGYDRGSEERVPITYRWQDHSKSPVIRWKSEYFQFQGVTNQNRCEEASRYFQTAYEEERFLFQAGTWQEKTVVCAVVTPEDDCGENYLFELKPSDDPELITEWLTEFFEGNQLNLVL